MIFEASLGLRGLSAATCGKIEPHLGQAQQPALLENRLGLLRTFDDLGGSEPIIFFLAHVVDVAIDRMV
jgi:hypothetical protein